MEQSKNLAVSNEILRECLPMLKKYFGINLGHFERELMAAWGEMPNKEHNELLNQLKEGDSLVEKYLQTDSYFNISSI